MSACEKCWADMPTEERAIHALFNAWYRLKELGWKEACYAPCDSSPLDLIEAGSTGIHQGYRDKERRFWIAEAEDIWPCTPVLYRSPAQAAHREEEHDGGDEDNTGNVRRAST